MAAIFYPPPQPQQARTLLVQPGEVVAETFVPSRQAIERILAAWTEEASAQQARRSVVQPGADTSAQVPPRSSLAQILSAWPVEASPHPSWIRRRGLRFLAPTVERTLELEWDERGAPSSEDILFILQWDEYGSVGGGPASQPLLLLEWDEVVAEPVLVFSWDELGDGLQTVQQRDRRVVSAQGTKTP